MNTRIANLALRHLGNSNEISSEVERSQEARAMKVFYDIAKEEFIRAAKWPWARKNMSLALVAADLKSEWTYTYRMPADCVLIRGILLPGYYEESLVTRAGYAIPYVEGSDASGRTIRTNLINPILSYSDSEALDESKWPADVQMTFSFLLASYAAPSITGGDPFKLGARAMQMYEIKLEQAKVTAYNEEYSQPSASDSELESSRY